MHVLVNEIRTADYLEELALRIEWYFWNAALTTHSHSYRLDAVFSMQQIVQGDKSYYEIFKTII